MKDNVTYDTNLLGGKPVNHREREGEQIRKDFILKCRSDTCEIREEKSKDWKESVLNYTTQL